MIGEQFIRGWLDLPKKLLGNEQEDSVYYRESDFFRFFCYYLAFNHMYDGFNARHASSHGNLLLPNGKPFLKATRERMEYDAWRQEDRKKWRRSDREKIMVFVDDVIKKARRSDLSSCLENPPELFSSPVLRRNPSTRKDEPEDCLINDIETEIASSSDSGQRSRLAIMRSLLRIYQVRCNLFHGDKDSSNDHDRELVKAGADYLERFIMLCITDLYGVLEY